MRFGEHIFRINPSGDGCGVNYSNIENINSGARAEEGDYSLKFYHMKKGMRFVEISRRDVKVFFEEEGP